MGHWWGLLYGLINSNVSYVLVYFVLNITLVNMIHLLTLIMLMWHSLQFSGPKHNGNAQREHKGEAEGRGSSVSLRLDPHPGQAIPGAPSTNWPQVGKYVFREF